MEEYRQVSRRERRIQYYFRILAAEKEQHQYDKIKEEREMEANKTPPAIASRGGRY